MDRLDNRNMGGEGVSKEDMCEGGGRRELSLSGG
jgi:hypothetical protein